MTSLQSLTELLEHYRSSNPFAKLTIDLFNWGGFFFSKERGMTKTLGALPVEACMMLQSSRYERQKALPSQCQGPPAQ